MIAKTGLVAIMMFGFASPSMAYDAVSFQHDTAQRAHCLATTHSEIAFESCVSGTPANPKAWLPTHSLSERTSAHKAL
jgi:hypothetical protein